MARTVLRMSVMSVFIGGTDEGSGREGCLNVSKGVVTNYGEGGYKTGGGGHVKFYPYEKGGQKKF